MTKKELRQKLPDLPEEHIWSVIKLLKSERDFWYVKGVDSVKYLLNQVIEVPSEEIDDHCVIHTNQVDGG